FCFRFFNDFKPSQIIGWGAFEIVFKAKNIFDKGTYAVKRIQIKVDCSKYMALQEIRNMADFDHPGIVRYNNTWMEQPPTGWQVARFDDNSHERTLQISYYSTPWLCIFTFYDQILKFQLCDDTLSDWLSTNPSNRGVDLHKSWFKQIVSAIAYLHGKRIMHRSLAPTNILFAGPNRLKVADFAIATTMEMEGDSEIAGDREASCGIPLYMAPEQVGDSTAYSSKVDIFSLGLIFAELSVQMTRDQRSQVFENYRRGISNDIL
ncbi:hypothetical protein PFISCL1PPCAC_7494, partial [Pristionchus fissidentatus]